MTSFRQFLLGCATAAAMAGTYLVLTPPAPSGADGSALLDPAIQAQAKCGAKGMRSPLGSAAAMARIPWLNQTAGEEVPLWEGLGNHSLKVSTRNKKAQRYFDQGLALAYGFNHAEAIRSFRKAQALDPKCAMCFWGEAYAFGPNINLAMPDEARAPAYAAALKAVELSAKASPMEAALIKAMAKRYSDDPKAERPALDKEFALAMAEVAKEFPADPDVQTVYADALMNLRPWNYWQADGVTPYEEVAALVPSLEKALEASPNHPQLIHLYIHAVEATPEPAKAEKAADRLAPLMPAAGHMVHMPAHIYMRVGRHADSIRLNKAAAAADEAYISAAKATGVYPSGYYPHNVHFVLVSAHLAGDRSTLLETAKKLDKLVADEVAKTAFWTQPVKAAGLLSLAHAGDSEFVLAAEKPIAELPYNVAMWHYARGLAFLTSGDRKGATAELKALEALSAAGELMGYPQEYLPADLLGDIAITVLKARLARDKGDLNNAIQHYRKAADLQAKLPYTEPPFWYFQVKESLGVTLLEAGRAKEATNVFQASLLDQPGNAIALYGLMRAYEKLGNKAEAGVTRTYFERAWLGGDTMPDMKRI